MKTLIYCVDPSWKVSLKRGVDTFVPKCQHQKIVKIAGFLKFKTFPYETLLWLRFYFSLPFWILARMFVDKKYGWNFPFAEKMHMLFVILNLKTFWQNSTSNKTSFNIKIFLEKQWGWNFSCTEKNAHLICNIEFEETFCQQLNFK